MPFWYNLIEQKHEASRDRTDIGAFHSPIHSMVFRRFVSHWCPFWRLSPPAEPVLEDFNRPRRKGFFFCLESRNAMANLISQETQTVPLNLPELKPNVAGID